MSTRPVRFCDQIINLITISLLTSLSPAIASQNISPNTSPKLLPHQAPKFAPDYRAPARETPLRTDSAGVRLSDEKGPSSVTQNTIAIERPITYQPAIGNLIAYVQTLIPKFPLALMPKSILTPNQAQPNQRPKK